MKKGKTFIICGPSGVGKGTVVARLLESDPSLYFSVSATTRAPRAGEEDGVHYHFLTREKFQEWIAAGDFLEYAQFVGNFYGTPRRYVDQAMEQGRDVLLDIEIQGAAQIHAKRPEAVRIYVAPPSWEELERRLTGRGTEDMEKIRSRLARGKEEFAAAKDFDYFVINDTVDRAVDEIRAIMLAEHCRPEEQEGFMNDVLESIKTRRSIRKYKPDPVPQDILDQIIEAGTYAASGKGEQSAIIIQVSSREMRDKIAEMNRQVGGWPEGFDPFYGAPVMLIVLARKDNANHVYDGSLVMGNLMLAAHALGLGSCWINRAKQEFESEEGKAILRSLGIEEEYEGIGHCALGYVDGEVPQPAARKENRVYYIK